MRKRGSGVRRAILLVATAALVLSSASVAYAASYDGTRGDNRFVGTDRGDRAVMRAGDDYANGKGGADFLFGNDGVDRLYGEDGSDSLNGGDGDDLIVGGEGEDELVGSRGDDTIYTGTEAEGDKTADEVQCGDGHDVVYLAGQGHSAHNLQAGACEEINSY